MKLIRVLGLIVCFFGSCTFVQASNIDDTKQKYNRTTPEQIRNLADMFAGGVGVPADVDLALDLYRDAADAGDTEAAFSAGFRLIYANEKSELSEEAVGYLNQAASKKHPAATLWLGTIFEQSGEFDKATTYYQRAAAIGAPGAYDRWSMLLIDQPATKQNLATLYAFTTQEIPLAETIKKQVLEKNYLPILGREDARFLQERLTRNGFDTQGMDGIIGPNSQKALAAFQESKGRNAINNSRLSIFDLKDLGFF